MNSTITVRPSVKLVALYGAFFVVLLLAMYLQLSSFPFFGPIWRIVVAIGGITLVYMQLTRLTSVFTLNPLEMTATVGILSRSSIRIPLNRICNYEVRRTFLERLVGLGDVLVDTPGTSGHELIMEELDKSAIDAVVTQLNNLLAQQKIADAGDNTELREASEEALEKTGTIST